MHYATMKELQCAKKKAWNVALPGDGFPPSDPNVPHSLIGDINSSNCYGVPKIGDGLGISAKRFPNIKGADLFYP